MAKSLEDIYASMDAQANQADGIDNRSSLEKYAYSALDDGGTQASQAPQAEEAPAPRLGQDLEVVDGDTVKFGGISYRLSGYDSAETDHGEGGNAKAKKIQSEHGIALEDQFAMGEAAKARLQVMIDKGQLTAKDLVRGTSGIDAYGRTLSNVGHVTDALINEGLVAPTDKYDDKRQAAFRAYSLKQKKAGKDGKIPAGLELLNEMRLDSAGGQDQHVDEYLGNLGNKALGSVSRAASSFGDFLLDVTVGTITKNAGRVVNALGGDVKWDGNIKLLDDASKQEYWDDAYGVDRSDDKFAIDEMMFDYDKGNYASAFAKGVLMAPDTLIDSSGDMALAFVPFAGIATKGAQLANRGGKIVNALSKAAEVDKKAIFFTSGTVVAGLTRANTQLGERMENNGGRENSPAEVFAASITGIVSAASERIALKGIGASAVSSLTSLEFRATISALPPSALNTAIKGAGAGVVGVFKTGGAALVEGTQELGQTLGEILVKQYGTDVQKNSDGSYKSMLEVAEANKRELIIATILGAGAGAGMHGGGQGLGLTAQGTISAYTILSQRIASRRLTSDFSNLSASDRATVDYAMRYEQEVLDKLKAMPDALRAEIEGAITKDENGIESIDMNAITSPEAKTALYSGLIQEIHDAGEEGLSAKHEAITKHYAEEIKSILANSEVDRGVALAELQAEMSKFTAEESPSPLIDKAVQYLEDLQDGKALGKEAYQEIIDHMDKYSVEAFDKAHVVNAMAYHTLYNPTNDNLTHDTAGKDLRRSSATVLTEFANKTETHSKNLTRMRKMHASSTESNPSRIIKKSTEALNTLHKELSSAVNSKGSEWKHYEVTRAKIKHIEEILSSRKRVFAKFNINQNLGSTESTKLTLSVMEELAKASVSTTFTELMESNDLISDEAMTLLNTPEALHSLVAEVLRENATLNDEQKAIVSTFIRNAKSDLGLDEATHELLSELSSHIFNSSDISILERMKESENIRNPKDTTNVFGDVTLTDIEFSTEQATKFAEELGIIDLLC